jgi:hypothetical protein
MFTLTVNFLKEELRAQSLYTTTARIFRGIKIYRKKILMYFPAYSDYYFVNDLFNLFEDKSRALLLG